LASLLTTVVAPVSAPSPAPCPSHSGSLAVTVRVLAASSVYPTVPGLVLLRQLIEIFIYSLFFCLWQRLGKFLGQALDIFTMASFSAAAFVVLILILFIVVIVVHFMLLNLLYDLVAFLSITRHCP